MVFGKNEYFLEKNRTFPVKELAQPFYYHDEENDTAAFLVHGFTGSPYDVRELGDYLFEHGINVKGVRLAGHGTDPVDLMHTTVHDWVDSAEESVAELFETHERVFLVGYSFGANIVLDMAARQSEKYSGVVCLGGSVFLRMSKPTMTYLKYVNHGMRFFGKHLWRKSYVPKDKVEAFESTGNYASIPLKSMLDWEYFVEHHTKKNLENITSPILIIHSRNDRISHPKSSEYLFQHVSSKYKEMFILPEFNHNPLRSESKDRIFSKVLNFIES